MSFLYWLESSRTPFLDTLMSLITHIGEETVFLVIALLMFWCVEKRRGYTFLLVGFVGICVNQLLKLIFRIPRPWVKDPTFRPVDSAIAEASGYSFPSGHTQNAIDTFGCIARGTRRRALQIVCAVIIVLVSFSRMYLGVHTPLDVGVSLGTGLILVFGLYPVIYRATEKPSYMWITLSLMTLASVALLLYTQCFPSPADVDAENLLSGQKNAYTMLGCSLAMLVVYAIDCRFLHFKTGAPLPGQAIKLILGAAIAFALKTLLKAPLEALLDGHMIARAIRYFIIVLFAGVVWPLTFPWWTRLGSRPNTTRTK